MLKWNVNHTNNELLTLGIGEAFIILIIPQRVKRVGEFNKKGHKIFLPTHIGSGRGMTL